MKHKLIEYFLKITKLTQEEISALTDTMVVSTFKKDSCIIKEGQPNKNTFFVLDGLVRQYKILEGEDVTTNFYGEGQWIISLTSFTENIISTDTLVCVEDTAVVVGNEEKAQALFKDYPRFETVSRMVMETVFANEQKRLASYLTSTPEKRYLSLLKTQPYIFQKVPQYHIASYVGIKPESLSRIRKRLALS